MKSHGLLLLLCAALMFAGCAAQEVKKTEPKPAAPQADPFADAMAEGRQNENKGDLAAALASFNQALSLKPDDAEAREAVSRVEDKRAARTKQKTETAKVLKKKYPDFRTHVIQPGETLSNIAMQYYGTYKTRIYYEPEQKKLMVSDLIARYNNTDARSLRAGQELRLPTLKELPFIDDAAPEGPPPAAVESPTEPKEAPAESPAAPDEAAPAAPEAPAESTETPADDDLKEAAAAEAAQAEAHDQRLKEGIAYFNQRKYRQAIDALGPADADPEAREYLARAHLAQGRDLLNAKDYLKARDGFIAALEYDPGCEECRKLLEKSEQTYLDIHYKKGIEHFQNEELKAAIYEWKLVQAIDPRYKQVTENIETAENLLEKLEKI